MSYVIPVAKIARIHVEPFACSSRYFPGMTGVVIPALVSTATPSYVAL